MIRRKTDEWTHCDKPETVQHFFSLYRGNKSWTGNMAGQKESWRVRGVGVAYEGEGSVRNGTPGPCGAIK